MRTLQLFPFYKLIHEPSQRIGNHVQTQQDDPDYWTWWPSWTMAVYFANFFQQLFK